jgi:hypothetical protein
VGFHVVRPEQLDWEPYDQYPGRHRAALTEAAALRHTRANFIRHEPGEKGPRHIERVQDGPSSCPRNVDDVPRRAATRHEISVGGLVHVEAGTAQQMVNGPTTRFSSSSGAAERAGADVIERRQNERLCL